MNELRYYGFILFYNIKDGTDGHIGPSYSTVTKIQGDVSFSRENLSKNFPNINLYKKIYLVSYVQKILLKKKGCIADDIRIINEFDKKQFKGTLSVDGVGNVRFKNKETGEDSYLGKMASNSTEDSHESRSADLLSDSKKSDVQPVPGNLPFSIEGLDILQKKTEDGVQTSEILVPFDRLIENYGKTDNRIGIVNYFIPISDYGYIRNHYKNRIFGEDNPQNDLHLMRPAEADISRVGKVRTSTNLYLVSYRESGETISDLRDPSIERNLASSVQFLFPLRIKDIYQIVVEETGVRFVFVAQNGSKDVKTLIEAGPREGQTLEGYLNEVASTCLRDGVISVGLEEIENYRDRVDENTYYSVRYRLYLRLCKDVADKTNLQENDKTLLRETVNCIEHILNFTSKPKYRLTLLSDMGSKLSQLGKAEEAKSTWQSWMRQYRMLVTDHPEEEDGLKTQYESIRRRLSGSEDADYLSEEEGYLTDAEELFEYSGDKLRDIPFVDEMLESERFSCERVFGEQFAGFDDLQVLFSGAYNSEEVVESIRKFLDEHKLSDQSNREWAIARLYDRLEDSPVPVLDEEEVQEKRDAHIREALYLEAKARLVSAQGALGGGMIFRSTALYLCSLALSDTIDNKCIVAAIGTVCLPAKEFSSALNGNYSLKSVLLYAKANDHLKEAVHALVLLAGRSYTVREYAEKMITSIDWADSANLEDALLKELHKYSGENGNSLIDAMTFGAKRFSNLIESFYKNDNGDKYSDIADHYLSLFEMVNNEGWDMFEKNIRTEDLINSFTSIKGYDVLKGFENKSRIIKDFLKHLGDIRDKIRKTPSILSDACYRLGFERLEETITTNYRKLCQTTKPLVKLGANSGIEVVKTGESSVLLRIPITSAGNMVQDARNVMVKIQPDSKNDFSCNSPVQVVNNLPSDGRTVMAEVPLSMIGDKKMITVQMQLIYDYISDVKIEIKERVLKSRGRSKKRTVRSVVGANEVIGKAVFPGADQWVSYDISLEVNPFGKTKRIISGKRLNTLSLNGKPNMRDPGIRRLLKNRESQIETAINAITLDHMGDDGEEKKVFNPMGRWVILYGQWRVGKTIILRCIEERLKDQTNFPHAIILRVDIGGIGTKPRFEDYFASEILGTLNEMLGIRKHRYSELYSDVLKAYRIDPDQYYADPDDNNDNGRPICTWAQFVRFFNSFLTSIREMDDDAAIVLLVDEFTSIYQAIINRNVDTGFPARWTEMIDRTNLLCITAGGEHTGRMMDAYAPNTLQKADEKIYVDYLSKEDTDYFVHYALEETPEDSVSSDDSYFSDASDEALERIYTLTRGNAYLLAKFCQWLIKYLDESGSPYLTKTVVNGTLDYAIRQSGSDKDSLETDLFNSLYNPYNEKSGETEDEQKNILRMEDDMVKEDNLRIFHAIVALADAEQHICTYDSLKNYCEDTGMKEERFIACFNTLKLRKVVQLDNNDNVSVFVDLYYEIVSRLERRRKDGTV